MKIYVQGSNERRESRELWLNLAERISLEHDVVNWGKEGLETSLAKAEQADAVVAELGAYDDASWAVIGMAMAGKRPIVPIWVAGFPYPAANLANPAGKAYGFIADVHRHNRYLVRSESDSKPWPSTETRDIVDDLRILEENPTWRQRRIAKPGKESVDLSLPVYTVGDSRQWWDQFAFYCIEASLGANGVSVINPSRVLDNYNLGSFPDVIEIDPAKDNDELCFQNATTSSSMMVSRGIHIRNLLGARVEEGAAWFHGHPILYLNSYVFPGRGSPSQKYREGKDPGMHLKSVFDQNRDLWGMKQHEFRTVGQVAREICKIRGLEYKAPDLSEIMLRFHDVHTQLHEFAKRYSIE